MWPTRRNVNPTHRLARREGVAVEVLVHTALHQVHGSGVEGHGVEGGEQLQHRHEGLK